MLEALLAIAANLTIAIAGNSEATLLFAGDAMMHQAQIEAAHSLAGGNGYDYSDCFTPVRDIISDADYAVVNLETPLGHQGFTGYPCFNAPVEYAEALRDAGFDLFLTANNHTLDRRDKGLKLTVALLDSLKIPHLGTYTDRAERDRRIPMVIDVKGFKVGILNYTYGTNGFEVQTDAVVDYIDKRPDQTRHRNDPSCRSRAYSRSGSLGNGICSTACRIAEKTGRLACERRRRHGYRRTSACGGTDGAAHQQHHGPKAGGGLFLRQLHIKHEDTRHAWRRICDSKTSARQHWMRCG